jgi:hypothetical protein
MIAKHLFDCPLDDETGLCGFTPVLLVTLGANRTGLGNRGTSMSYCFQL